MSNDSFGHEHDAAVFAALGDETRLGLVRRLVHEGPLSITRLAEGSGVTRQAVTKHLQVLSEAGLVRGSKHGREHRWELEPLRLDEARRVLEQMLARLDEALDRLRSYVEEDSKG